MLQRSKKRTVKIHTHISYKWQFYLTESSFIGLRDTSISHCSNEKKFDVIVDFSFFFYFHLVTSRYLAVSVRCLKLKTLEMIMGQSIACI